MTRAGLLLALLLGACGAERDYAAAMREDSPAGWDKYLRLNPDGPHSRAARARLEALVDEREWHRARLAATGDAYERYLHGYPHGAHAAEARGMLAGFGVAASLDRDAPDRLHMPPDRAIGSIARRPPSSGEVEPGGFGVQLGAFAAGDDAAGRAWRALAVRHPPLGGHPPSFVESVGEDGRAMVRLQVVGLDRTTAETLCADLATTHDACLVVPPAPQAGTAGG